MSKVLIVEDEEKIRNLYRRMLTAEGIDVAEAENGEKAAMVLLQDKCIDLFLLDIHMPVVNGVSLFEAVRVFNPHAKVIVASVYPLEDQKRMIRGADDYFDKAEGADVLVERVKSALQPEAWKGVCG